MVGFESKMRWGDSLDEEDEQEEALPPPSVAGPDEHGIKTITEYHRNEKGQAVVVTTKVKVAKMQKKVYAISKERRNWAKFGDAFGQDSSENITMRSREDIMLERINLNTSTNEADKKIKTLENALSSNDNTMVVGSLRDLLYKKRMERQLMAARGLIDAPEKPPGEDDVMGGTSKGGYVAPGMRGGPGSAMGGESMRRPRDENSIRVTNLSEDTREHDLQKLFRPFGPISRIYVAFDRETGESRGFAFVNFMERKHAQLAIDKLDGYGYDNLILRVEWAQPRPERAS